MTVASIASLVTDPIRTKLSVVTHAFFYGETGIPREVVMHDADVCACMVSMKFVSLFSVGLALHEKW